MKTFKISYFVVVLITVLAIAITLSEPDLRTNKLNCGRCGKSCQYSEICCKGYCVNPMFDKRHCGGCFKKCNKGRSCAYGMCNYA
ncbi:hypothetical protein F2Q69_00063498 [Brassica cretica]|uniref:Stigma-specific STIG1-like protein 1 n=1 Tax=Brassica cretica TaxID=69181 RepID=A0A8S9REY3_BRACR|nr:hypothetical protein F2Q69_00063498 [Brassica cretica]